MILPGPLFILKTYRLRLTFSQKYATLNTYLSKHKHMKYNGEKTPHDIRYENLLASAPSQATMDEFVGLPNFDQARLAVDARHLQEKQDMAAYDEDDRDAKALEVIVAYLGNNDELFDGCSYADPGSEFDDNYHGADVVCGMKIPGRTHDVIFSLDVCSAVSPSSVAKKFGYIDRNDSKRPDIPGTSRLDYYAHYDRNTGKTRRTHIARVPNYIVGARPATVGKSVDKFDFSEPGSIRHEQDKDLQIELLVEIFLQARTHYLACRNLSERGKNTSEVYEMHKAVADATQAELIRLSGTTETPPNFTKIVMDYLKQYSYDDTFRAITNEAYARLKEQATRSKAIAAMKTADKLQKPKTNPVPKPA